MPLISTSRGYGWVFPSPEFNDKPIESESYPWLRLWTADPNLCLRCRNINFGFLFRGLLKVVAFQWRGNTIRLSQGIRLGSLDDIRATRTCHFCSYIWDSFCSASATYSQPFEPAAMDLWLDNYARGYECTADFEPQHSRSRPPTTILLRISVRDPLSVSEESVVPGKEHLHFDIQNHTEMSKIIDLEGHHKKEFWRLLRWVDSCEQCHRDSSLVPIKGSGGDIHESLELYSRVLDVYRRRIVQAPKGCRYVALSYVWGDRNYVQLGYDNLEDFEKDGSVDLEELPRTICDAVAFCRELGERYLWIDSLCINQDGRGKHAHIKSMEAVYRGAKLTLVAAAGDHADAGLPGFSAETFAFHPCSAVIQQLKLATVSPSFEESVDLSAWNTRAWTYQERLLSRRLIIFTTNGIYFQCDHGRSQHDSCLDPHDPASIRYSQSDDGNHGEKYRLKLKRRVNFDIYAQAVSEYTGRKLSFPSDIENAFGGILKIVSLLFNGSEVLCGVPIASLSLGLLWRPTHRLTRRTRTKTTAKDVISTTSITSPPSVPQPLPNWPTYQAKPPATSVDNFANRIKNYGFNTRSIRLYCRQKILETRRLAAEKREPATLSPQITWQSNFQQSPANLLDPHKIDESAELADGTGFKPPNTEYIFPSWSWMGWDGPIDFGNLKNLAERTISMVEWLDPLNRLKPLPEEHFGAPPQNWDGSCRWLRQVSTDDEVYYTQVAGDNQDWYCHPMEPFFHNPIPICRDTQTLHLRTRVADGLEVTKRGLIEGQPCFSIAIPQQARAGLIVLDDPFVYSGAPSTYKVVLLSQTTLKEGREDPAWDSHRAQYSGKPGGPPINTFNMDTSGAEELFDTSVYDPTISWCLYNVLVVQGDGEHMSRIGIGKMHIHAFDQVASPPQDIYLH